VVCLVVFCMSAIAAASASARTGQLVNTAGNALVHKHFTGTYAEIRFETVAGSNWGCKSGTATGEFTSKTAGTQNIAFKGCKSSLGPCKTEGAGIEEMKFTGVALSVLNSKTPAKDLLSNAINGTAKFKCAGGNWEDRGTFLIPITPSQEAEYHTTFLFTSSSSATGVQSPTGYETTLGEHVTLTTEWKLLANPFEQAAQVGTETVVLEESAKFV
jgi:hypothetical protein